MRFLRLLGRIWTVLLGCVAIVIALAITIRVLVPLAPWLTPPTVHETLPLNGARAVVPRSPLVFVFSEPMNRRSVELALHIDPPTKGEVTWSDENRRLVFTPATPLLSATTYTLRLPTTALSRWWQPLATPLTTTFHTATAPQVLTALPLATDHAVPTDTQLALVFSQPMVSPTLVETPTLMPQLTLSPTLAVETTWANVYTLLVRPLEPLLAATRYQATLAAELPDALGVELGQPYTWGWQTLRPTLRLLAPLDAARWVAQQQPLVFTLTAPLDVARIRSGLRLEPAQPGEITTGGLPNGTQVITYTPQGGWPAGQRIAARFRLESADQPPTEVTWHFTVAPLPTLTARFPGQGQILPRGQAIRLVFSTPMDGTSLRNGLQFDPPVANLQVSTSETEVRILGDLATGTTYTLMVAPEVTDRTGVALGSMHPVVFRTAPSQPRLHVRGAGVRPLQQPTNQVATLAVEHGGITRLELALYRLDEAALLRTLDFGPQDWSTFQPERYALPLLRTWSVPLAGASDQPVRSTIPLTWTAPNRPLEAGFYYVRLRGSDGSRTDLVLAVGDVRLMLILHEGELLVWATDQHGLPVADVPLTLYGDELVLARGRSDAGGLWRVSLAGRTSIGPYLVLATDDHPALMRSDWEAVSLEPTPIRRAFLAALFTEYAAYRPGETVHIGGVVRRMTRDGTILPPLSDTRCTAQLINAAHDQPVLATATTCSLSATGGGFAAALTLDPALPPGAYRVRVRSGDFSYDLPLTLLDAAPSFALNLQATPGLALLTARAADQPLTGVTVTWQLQSDPLPPLALPAGFVTTLPPPALLTLAGDGTTDQDGQVPIPLPAASTITTPLRFTITAHATEPGGGSAWATTSVAVSPSPPRVGIRLPARIVDAGTNMQVALGVFEANGRRLGDRPLLAEVFRLTSVAGQEQATSLLLRSLRTDTQGTAGLRLAITRPGHYRLVVASNGQRASAEFWVAAPVGVNAELGLTAPLLIAERQQYGLTDTIRLLTAFPTTTTTGLVLRHNRTTVAAETRPLRSGQVLTVTATPAMTPTLGVTILAAGDQGIHIATLELPIAPPPTLQVALTTDRTNYLGGETALVSITVRNRAGQPQPADLLLALLPTTDDPVLPSLGSRVVAALRGEIPAPAIPTLRLLNAQLHSGNDGQLRTYISLPKTWGHWRIEVIAIGADPTPALASTDLQTSAPPQLALGIAPFLRPGDRTSVLLETTNPTNAPAGVTVTLNTHNTLALIGNAEQYELLPAFGTTAMHWELAATSLLTGQLTFAAQILGRTQRVIQQTIPVIPLDPQADRATGPTPYGGPVVAINQAYEDPVRGDRLEAKDLHVGQLVRVRVRLVLTRPMPGVTLVIPLPAALVPLEESPDAPFQHVAYDTHEQALIVGAPDLQPGIYSQSYRARVVAAGSFSAPAPRAFSAAYPAAVIQGQAARLEIGP